MNNPAGGFLKMEDKSHTKEVRKIFFIKLFELLTKRIRAKVVFFEIGIIIMVSFSLGLIFSLYLEKTLLKKADLFCERILQDLSKSIEYNYISISAASEAIKSFEHTAGIRYLGYTGHIMAGDELKKVHLFTGINISEDTLAEIEKRIKNLNTFYKNSNLIKIYSQENNFENVIEYCMPVSISVGDKIKKIGHIVLWYSEKEILKEIYFIRNLIVFVTFAVALFAIFLSIKGSDSIVRPIVQLTDAVKKFGQGDLNIRIQVPTKDEIGILAKTFDEMVLSFKEKLEMQKFVSSSTIKMIQKTVSTDISRETKVRPTERATLTMLFSDIRGFTAMSEKLDPKQVVDILNEYLDIQTNIIKECKGDIDKFVGDEIVAVFEGEDMCLNAIKASCEIQRKLAEINKERIKKHLSTVNVGIGINVGEVVRGSIGSHDRMDYTVIGDSVNLASRLCSVAGKDEIIISKDVYDRVATRSTEYKFVALEPIYVKGKSNPIEVFKVEY
jgi:adenylate cyclase